MSAISEIENLKCNSFVEAKKVSFPVVDETQSLIGTLVPIGEWIFDYKDIIEQICNWRQKAMRYFLSQFESTITRTESYLRELSIQDQGRVLFLIFSTDELLVGHIGIKDVDGRSGGVDNAMRGRSGGHPKLIFFSEKAILKWCFQSLQLSLVHLEVLSYNAMSIELHSQFGFMTDLKVPLRKEDRYGEILHLPVRAPEANVDYTCNRMTLTKERYMSNCESAD